MTYLGIFELEFISIVGHLVDCYSRRLESGTQMVSDDKLQKCTNVDQVERGELISECRLDDGGDG